MPPTKVEPESNICDKKKTLCMKAPILETVYSLAEYRMMIKDSGVSKKFRALCMKIWNDVYTIKQWKYYFEECDQWWKLLIKQLINIKFWNKL